VLVDKLNSSPALITKSGIAIAKAETALARANFSAIRPRNAQVLPFALRRASESIRV
jgi:hypothetical protein